MVNTAENRTLSTTDAFFLYLENPGAPLNVASICVFDGIISFDECVAYIQSKLPLIPRFMQRIQPPALGLAAPMWVDDPSFDVHNHVHEIKLKRGSDTEWKAAVSRILSEHLDRNRPLWGLTIVRGLPGRKTGVVIRTHHCLVDGIAGVALMKALLDENPKPPKFAHKKLKPEPAPPPAQPALLDTIIQSCLETSQALLTVHSEILQMAQRLTSGKSYGNGFGNGNGAGTHEAPRLDLATNPLGAIAPLGELAQLLTELAQPTQKLPFNTLCRGPQKFDWTEIPIDELIRIKETGEATLNEVVLTILSGALRRYAELHSLNTKRRSVRVVIPVNIRAEGEDAGVGNRITFLPVDIPIGTHDPRKLLATVKERVAFGKAAHGAELVGLAGMLLGTIPTPLQMLVCQVLRQLPISLLNTICTNVPGPRTALYLLGHKLLSAYPYVPIGGEIGMNCAVLSYNGTLFVGFTGDAPAIPDIAELAKFFRESYTDLRSAMLAAKDKRTVSRKRAPKKHGRKRPLKSAVRETPAAEAAPEPASAMIERETVESQVERPDLVAGAVA
ncbi:MAG TPA: wax ester/triacylglycerol synthase family O-acyltransferase [candidate division Zixibacteria bacterium]|nr:wax ester/triacylglycerol synthase family O-acyltransferase [candidate division Zixibacteria bacterium]